jgi:two-component system NtrC family response regulator
MQKICRTVGYRPDIGHSSILGSPALARLLARAIFAEEEQPVRHDQLRGDSRNAARSEAFGYEKGAFTGATKQTISKIETAHGGTLFLDEIGDLSLALQVVAALLQKRVIERIGGRKNSIDVRSSVHPSECQGSNRNGKPRGSVLRNWPDRTGGTTALARQRCSFFGFVHRFGSEQKRGSMTLLPDAVAAIECHAWPGNVRELENVIKRAVIMADGQGIGAADIGISPEAQDQEAMQLNLRQVRDEAEKQAVLRALGRVNGNLSKAADLLGISRPTLYELIHRFGLK